MEATERVREETPAPDIADLIKRAHGVYETYKAAEIEIPVEELHALRGETEKLPEKQYKDLRVAIGSMALQGKLVIKDKDRGLAFMRMLFGDSDARLLENVSKLSRTLGMTIRDYTITSMLRVREQWNASKEKTTNTAAREDLRELNRAGRELTGFLAAVGGQEIRERIFLEEEALRQTALQEEIEKAFFKEKTPENIKRELASTRAEMTQTWKTLKDTPFEHAPSVVTRIIYLNGAAEELTHSLKHHGKKTVGAAETPTLSGTNACRRILASALMRLSKGLHEEMETNRREPEKLLVRAGQYEAEAGRLLGEKPQHQGGAS